MCLIVEYKTKNYEPYSGLGKLRNLNCIVPVIPLDTKFQNVNVNFKNVKLTVPPQIFVVNQAVLTVLVLDSPATDVFRNANRAYLICPKYYYRVSTCSYKIIQGCKRTHSTCSRAQDL